MSSPAGPRPRVLVLSRNYPNSVIPLLGLWVQALVRYVAAECEVTVVAPTPYWPPLPGPREYTRFAAVERERREGEVAVYHPRFLVGPGYVFHSFEAASYFLAVRGLCDRIRSARGIDLIHAHFGYPDGVVAALLGRRYGVPVIVTEHAFLHPWFDRYPLVRRQTLWSRRHIAAHIAVSERVRREIEGFAGGDLPVRVIPVGVDGKTFTLRETAPPQVPPQVLYVGHITYNKGVDVLIEAAANLLETRRDLRFVLVGEGLYRHKRIQEQELQRLARRRGLQDRVLFVGGQSAEQVARWMRESALLVLPSPRETFGAVLVEALASGTPVVATESGGPEEIVTEGTGALVPPGDAAALAQAIARVLDERERYDPRRLREDALERFSWENIAMRTIALYREVLGSSNRESFPAEDLSKRKASGR